MAIEGLKATNPSRSLAGSMGHESEPKQPHGPRVGGKHPPVHSHSARPKRHIKRNMRKR
jgi:hypothetical protein